MACNRSQGWFVVAAFLALAALLASCSSDDDSGGAADDTVAPTTAAPAESLRVLVTNDDGVDAPGIDAVVQALAALPDTEVVVVAPRENQSGGTDHGTASAHLVMGGKVRGGLFGAAPALDRLDGSGNLPFAVDFRAYYATFLERHWQVGARRVLGADFRALDFI